MGLGQITKPKVPKLNISLVRNGTQEIIILKKEVCMACGKYILMSFLYRKVSERIHTQGFICLGH